MSRVRSKDTTPEIMLRSALHRRGFRFRKHVQSLPGKPDIVFPRSRVVVFVDGEFWHGYRYSRWRDTLADFWKVKLDANRKRDIENTRRLRASGWRVIRVWQREVYNDLTGCLRKIEQALRAELT
jgi:DNA mismatch endonuclease (patch repair protein)